MNNDVVAARVSGLQTRWAPFLLAALSSFLVACGGGGGGGGSPIQTAPVVTSQPADAAVQAPATATFSATAGGTPAPTVQWQVSTDGGASWTPIAGAVQPAYTTPATTAADNAKRFRAVFSNSAGTAASNGAVLTVSTPVLGLSLLAGNIGGRGNFDGAGSAARFNNPMGVAVDAAGNVYVAEYTNSTIRKITPTGVVSTFAGRSLVRGRGDGTGSAALFDQPFGIAVDAAGNVYVADTGNNSIRKITPAAVVTTLAGTGAVGSDDGPGAGATFNAPRALALDATGNVYVADTYNSTIRKVAPDGVVSTIAGIPLSPGSADGATGVSQFAFPMGIAVAPSGDLHVADTANAAVRIVTPAGAVTTLVRDPAGLGQPVGIAVGAGGLTYVSESEGFIIRTVSPAGLIATLAGTRLVAGVTDGPAASALFRFPQGLAIDAAGTLYVADSQNNVVRTIKAGIVATLAGLASDTGSNDGVGASARFNFAQGVAVDAAGNAYVADYLSATIRKITPAGAVTTLAGVPDAVGHVDGAGSTARFDGPIGIAIDDTGTLYVTESANNTIRKITPAGVVSTLAGTAGASGSADGTGAAAGFSFPWGVAVDAARNVYVTDSGNSTVRKITLAGVVTTLAGMAGQNGIADGTGSAARFFAPQGIGVDAAGTLYLTDTQNATIRKITAAGVVTTLAGAPGMAGSADGLGSAARFSFPQAVAVDPVGNLFIADTGNYTIRKVSSTGTVTTVLGVVHEGGIRLGSDPRLYAPQGLAAPSSNSLVITTTGAVLFATLP